MREKPTADKDIFPPISDAAHFPLIASGSEQLCGMLMACDNLHFLAPLDVGQLSSARLSVGRDWHLYGDTRWPAPAAWVEGRLSHEGDADFGVLVMRNAIPAGEKDPVGWCARNNPLAQVLPNERSEETIRTRSDMLRAQASSTEAVAGPEDGVPASVQSYCIFHGQPDGPPRFVATYTDLVNGEGVPIPLFRTASTLTRDIDLCRLTLHTLFCLNEVRLGGAAFVSIPQFQSFGPALLAPGEGGPRWAKFHPSRTLRTRPLLRALPVPTEMKDGILRMADYERAADVARREMNLHTLAFERSARPRDMTLQWSSTNSSLASFIHRANGGAIYVLPDRLVEEFDNTDCSEVLVQDIALPFPDVFLKFTPPRPLSLDERALVDGCYVVKQGDEYLLMLTSRLEGVDYERSLSIACADPTFSLHLPAKDPLTSVNAAVDAGIEDFLAKNAPPEDDFSQTVERPDGTKTTVLDVRRDSRRRRIELFRSQEPVFRSCLNIVVNAACFIAFRPEDISEGWEGEPPAEWIAAVEEEPTSRAKRDRKRDAAKRIEAGDFTRIRICGKDLFGWDHEEKAPGTGTSPRAHWRRGHWRRQRHGVGLSLVSLRWIRPTIVKKDAGPLVETRLYEIDPSVGSGSDSPS